MCENLQDYCRFCLDARTEHVSIFKDAVIPLHIKSCLSFTVLEDDELPKVICKACVAQLDEFYRYQVNAKYSQEWLESMVREKSRKEHKILLPIPDSDYNSDSLLEFLNNTENIDEYLNSLGKEEIPYIEGMFDNVDFGRNVSPKKRDDRKYTMNMEIDVLDSHVEIVKELLEKETHTKKKSHKEKCNACNTKFDNIQKLTQHMTKCINLARYCTTCDLLFDSKHKLFRHKISYHTVAPFTCNCGKIFPNKDKLVQHYRDCFSDFATTIGCEYRCRECGVVTKDRTTMYDHAKKHVLKSQMKMCDECGHNFVGDSAVAMHKKKSHPKPDNVTFRCKVCHKTTSDRHELYNHIQRQHASALEPQRHLCDTCGQSFATRTTLMRHCLMHNSVSAPLVEDCSQIDDTMCEFCGEMINCNDLKVHFKCHK